MPNPKAWRLAPLVFSPSLTTEQTLLFQHSSPPKMRGQWWYRHNQHRGCRQRMLLKRWQMHIRGTLQHPGDKSLTGLPSQTLPSQNSRHFLHLPLPGLQAKNVAPCPWSTCQHGIRTSFKSLAVTLPPSVLFRWPSRDSSSAGESQTKWCLLSLYPSCKSPVLPG